jgi:hypothetical protein
MRKISFLFLLSLTFISRGQNIGQQQGWNYSNDWGKIEVLQKSNKIIGENISSEVEGSLYFSENYTTGQLLFEGKELDRNMLYRYEAYSDIIEVKLENGKEDFLAQSPKLEVIIAGDLYNYVQFYNESNKEMDFGYMIVMDKNEKYNLYDRKIKKLRPGKKATTSMSADLQAKLLDNETIYFRLAGDKFAKSFPDSKSSLFKMFPNQKPKLKKFLKSEKIDLENPEDVARVLEFCL